MGNVWKWLGTKVLQFLFVIVLVFIAIKFFRWELSAINIGPAQFSPPTSIPGNAQQPDLNATAISLAIQLTQIALQQKQPTAAPQLPISTQPPIQPTVYISPATDMPVPAVLQQDCWVTVWSFSPTNRESIFSSLTDPQSGFTRNFDTENGGSLRVETTRTTLGWSWIDNLQRVEARNGLYRVVATIKTQNTIASHVGVVGQDSSNHDVFTNGSNSMAVTPSIEKHGTRELTGNLDWATYYSRDFNPVEWNPNVKYIVVGLNAGWSPDGTPSITWFKDVQIQYCQP